MKLKTDIRSKSQQVSSSHLAKKLKPTPLAQPAAAEVLQSAKLAFRVCDYVPTKSAS